MSELDLRHMQRAIKLARFGEGRVEPNPMVGCVIAIGEQAVAEGWHQEFGGPHAEVVALKAVPQEVPLDQATMYVSLEPCCHFGKTPACTEAILASGVPRVVVAMTDPFAKVRGHGLDRLRAAGLQVVVGCLEPLATELNRPYLKRLERGTPWVIAKWAMTLDGKIAARTGDSQWISGERSREVVHRLRGRMDAIMVGRGTAIHDDPLLTARPIGPRVATRVVVDSQARLPLDAQLVRTVDQAPLLIAASAAETEVDEAHRRCAALEANGVEVLRLPGKSSIERLQELLENLGQREFTNVLVEGGGQLLGGLLDQKLIDEIHVFVAPRILGGADAISPIGGEGASSIADGLRLASMAVDRCGDDLYLHGRL